MEELYPPTMTSKTPTPVTIFCDYQSAIRRVKNPEFHQRTRHINVRYNFIKDYQEKNQIDMQYVESSNQLADIFTKPLPVPDFTDIFQLKRQFSHSYSIRNLQRFYSENQK